MGRMDMRGSPTVELAIPAFGGQNTAKTFSEIDLSESPKMINLLPNKIGGLATRPGTVPLTTAALANPIKVLCNLRKNGSNSIFASSNTTLYTYAAGTLTAQTMTNALTTAEIDTAQFKDASANEVLIIADGGNLKYSDGSTVQNITPAADDASPLPANVLATLNSTKPFIGILVHNNRLVGWGANSDQINHSKIGYFDYFEATSYQRFVRENDYVVQCVTYSGALIILMRRHIAALFGDGYSSPATAGDWSQDFLDTTDGCVNPRSVQTVIYPDGREEVFYQTDKGISAIYTINTLSLDTSARYSTRSASKYQIDWDALGVTNAEWAAASSYFYDGKYWLIYKKGSTWEGLVFDTNNQQWFPIGSISANSFYADENYFYFAGDEGHLKVFDKTLYSDYADAAKTSKTPFQWYWYSKLATPKLTGYDHFWDILMIEARQFDSISSIDVEVNTYKDQYIQSQAIATTIMIVGVTPIGVGQIANNNLTDIVNNAKRIETFLSGQYAQIKLSNGAGRDEPAELFSMNYEVRLMTKY